MLMAFCILQMFLGIAIFVVGGVLTAFGAAMEPTKGMSTEAKWFLAKCYLAALLLIFSSAYLMPMHA